MKTNQKLNEMVEKIDEKRRQANRELGDWPWQTRPGMEAAKAQARAELPKTIFEFEKVFGTTVAKVFVNGPTEKQEQFAEFLTKELTVFQVPDFYEELTSYVKPMVGLGGAFGSGAYLRLVDTIAMFSKALRVIPHNNLKEPVGLGVSTDADLVKIVKDITRAAFGDSLNRAYLHSGIVNTAVSTKFNKDFGVVLLKGMDDEERSYLTETLFAGQPSFALEIGGEEEVNKSMVLKIYRKIATSLAKNNTTESPEGTEEKE